MNRRYKLLTPEERKALFQRTTKAAQKIAVAAKSQKFIDIRKDYAVIGEELQNLANSDVAAALLKFPIKSK
jgi:hypothetical protein